MCELTVSAMANDGSSRELDERRNDSRRSYAYDEGDEVDIAVHCRRDASHGTLLFSAGVLSRVSGTKLRIGGRIGAGPTLVNFDEPAFHDTGGTAVRFEAIGEITLAKNLRLAVRPLTFDILSSRDLGGPITTWQSRVGLVYSFTSCSRRDGKMRSAGCEIVR